MTLAPARLRPFCDRRLPQICLAPRTPVAAPAFHHIRRAVAPRQRLLCLAPRRARAFISTIRPRRVVEFPTCNLHSRTTPT